MEFQCRGTEDGKIEFSPYGRAAFKDFLTKNPGIRLKITAELPESDKLRRYFEGALIPLIAFYQEGMDHRSSDDREKVREWLKEEFNGELVTIAGTVHRVGKTTKGRDALNGFVERVMDWLTDNYNPPKEAIDPKHFKTWRDTVFPFGGPETHIDYLLEMGILK